ncbi:MAG TPA: YggS family pyridoxal phosphate-dependent enzyme [Aldersonia sp.]
MNRADDLSAALTRVRDRLTRACEQAGRVPADVTLLPVTKFFPASDVEILYGLGCRAFGESREQEASAKVAALQHLPDIEWHMVGRLQRNKARPVARWAYAVHSVDNARLVDALEHAAEQEREDPLRVFVQVSLDDDPTRGGVRSVDLPALADRVAQAQHLHLAGLMAIPPLGADATVSFARLTELHAAVVAAHPSATGLSAGMSGDLEIAVEHGSTCVRVGTALMGARPITSP